MRGFFPRGATVRLLLAATALTVAGGSFAAGAPEVIGINAAVLNNVRIRAAGTNVARAAVVRQRVALADEVQTGGRSQLQVLLLDKSTFTVGANARLTIDRFVYDPARGARSVGASVVKGAFRFMSGRPDAKGSSSISTPVATIGIRGTIVDGVVGEDAVRIAAGERGVGPDVRSDPATASLIILRGPGRGAQGRVQPGIIDVSSGGRTVTVDRPMHAVYVPRPGAAPIGPFVISPEGLREVQALIFPSLAPRFGIGPETAGQPYYPVEDRPRPLPPSSSGRGSAGYPGGYLDGFSGGPSRQGPGSYIPSLPQGGFRSMRQQQVPTQSAPPSTMSAPQSPTPTPAPMQSQPSVPTPTPTPAPAPSQFSAPAPTPTPAPASGQFAAPAPAPTPLYKTPTSNPTPPPKANPTPSPSPANNPPAVGKPNPNNPNGPPGK